MCYAIVTIDTVQCIVVSSSTITVFVCAINKSQLSCNYDDNWYSGLTVCICFFSSGKTHAKRRCWSHGSAFRVALGSRALAGTSCSARDASSIGTAAPHVRQRVRTLLLFFMP